MMYLQELKHATVEKVESLVEDAKKNKSRSLNKLEYHLLIKYCVNGVWSTS